MVDTKFSCNTFPTSIWVNIVTLYAKSIGTTKNVHFELKKCSHKSSKYQDMTKINKTSFVAYFKRKLSWFNCFFILLKIDARYTYFGA